MSSSQGIPYQAYKPKRHSRAISSPPLDVPGNGGQDMSNGKENYEKVDSSGSNTNGSLAERPASQALDFQRRRVVSVNSINTSQRPQSMLGELPSYAAWHEDAAIVGPHVSGAATVPSSPLTTTAFDDSRSDDVHVGNGDSSSQAGPSSEAESSMASSKRAAVPRKSSSFRYVPLRPPVNSVPRTSSPLRPPTTPASVLTGMSSRQFDQRPRTLSEAHDRSSSGAPLNAKPNRSSLLATTSMGIAPAIPDTEAAPSHRSTPSIVIQSVETFSPPERISSLQSQPPAPPPKLPSPIASTSSARVSSPAPPSTPSTSASGTQGSLVHRTAYRPGFQPKGVYRPLTDEFLTYRRRAREIVRIEQTRHERRLEKLIQLHFPSNAQPNGSNDKDKAIPQPTRRASSLFELDISDLKSKSPSELWRGILENRASAVTGGKNDIRAAEQDITPWENDADVSACPLCAASFHPLTNRKHHCRICGKIICSLPVKRPQRPQPCSILFVVDPATRKIEEVSEGVDYGVRPRRQSLNPTTSGSSKSKGISAEEKFMKGVRICRDCKPVMLRQQYRQEAKREPPMVRLYRALVSLESEIEEALPQFEELIVNLSNDTDDAPTKEAITARKRLLEAFAEYDAISKRLRRLPCPDGPGSSQDRVLSAITNRANIFLQKNMFPLQSLPKPKMRTSPTSIDVATAETHAIDPDSELALALQPLLEQEALLESFIEEAKAHRKFEDAKTLTTNLTEIRIEIERIVANAEGGMS